jgi:phosphate acetyltransferase
VVRSLLVVPTSAGAGLARTCLGLVRALDRQGVNVAFVKPVAQPRADGSPDRSAALVAAITSRRPPDPLPTADLEKQLAERGLHAALEKIIAALEPVHNRSDVVVVEGLTPGPARLYAIEINQALARALDADVVLVASWPAPETRSAEDHADRTSEPALDPIAAVAGDLAETLAITAAGRASARGRLRGQRRA